MGSRALECPRCGYDLSGVATGFAPPDYPERGVCSECGLGYAWLDVLYPERRDVPWLVEHARGRTLGWRVLKAAWQTWTRTFVPFVFFAGVRVEHRVDLRRLLLWLFLVLVPVHAAASLLATIRVAVVPSLIGGGPFVARAWSVLDYISVWLYPIVTLRPSAAGAAGGLLPPVVVPTLLDAPEWVFPALAMHTAYALMLPLLFRTLGSAKVRGGHVLRAFVYGLSWIVLLSMFRLGRNALLLYELLAGPAPRPAIGGWGPQPLRLSQVDPMLAGGVVLSFVALWWMAAIVRGWRLGDAWLVWILLTVIGVLAAGIVAAYWEHVGVLLRLWRP